MSEERTNCLEPSGSVRLDGSKEFEILVNYRDFIRIPAKELKSLRSDYEEFKAEALRKGYKVMEHYDPSDQSHLARFTPPNDREETPSQ